MARILIVDDAAFMRMMIKDILGKNGYEVVGEANDGAEAIEKYKELKPDLVTMDITMPEMDGLELVQEPETLLRERQRRPFSSRSSDQRRRLLLLSRSHRFLYIAG